MSFKSSLLSKLVLAAALGSSALAMASSAEATPKSQSGKASLVVVDGDRGRVVYDDGYDDAFCVFRRVIVWNPYVGDYVIRKRMVCR